MHTQGEGPGPTPTAKHSRSSGDIHTHNEIQLWNALYSPGKETLYRIPIQIKQTGVYHQASMLKIRCTDVRETRHSNSQSTEMEKAKFHTPAIPNETRNCVKHNSAENISVIWVIKLFQYIAYYVIFTLWRETVRVHIPKLRHKIHFVISI